MALRHPSFSMAEMGGLTSVLKAILAVTLVGGATTAVVAPAFDLANARTAQRAASFGKAPLANQTPGPDRTYPPQVDYEALLRACLESRDPDGEACMNAQSDSSLSPEAFRAKIVARLATPTSSPTATPAPTQAADFAAALERCLATRDVNSDPCQRAFEVSGMTPKDFEETFYAKLEAKDRVAKATPKVEGDFATWFDKCLGTRDLGSDPCRRAFELSHMTRADFEQKYKAKLAAKDGGDFWAWFDRCLATRDVHSDACAKAQALIGFSDADFHAKFARYLAERDAKAGKTPAPTPTVWSAYVEQLVKDCLQKTALALAAPGSTEATTVAGQACQKAITATGLSPRDFWARYPVTQPVKN